MRSPCRIRALSLFFLLGIGVALAHAAGASCMVQTLLDAVGSSHLLVGASMSDAVAQSAPFDLRYVYLSGGLFDGAAPCGSCATGCSAAGQSCSNASGGCAWWGCWQYDQDPPGQYVRDFVAGEQAHGRIPMLTYYEILHASGAGEGAPEVAAAASQPLMARYLADWRFVLQAIGSSTAFLHVEPDFWGFAEQVDEDPHAIPAAVASANPTDCAGQENSIAGLGRCMIAMVRIYAPNARVGLHGSGWGTQIDVLQNRDPALDVAGEAQKLGAFLAACGADQGDFVVVDASDRDAGYYASIGQDRWWDATDATLPSFAQAFAWSQALAERVGRPVVWWQLPVGNMSLPNVFQEWKDNRVDYLFAHTAALAASHGAAMAFGAGDGNQTTPSTDGGNLVAKTQAYGAAGGQAPCPEPRGAWPALAALGAVRWRRRRRIPSASTAAAAPPESSSELGSGVKWRSSRAKLGAVA
jgi:hypothetical protein